MWNEDISRSTPCLNSSLFQNSASVGPDLYSHGHTDTASLYPDPDSEICKFNHPNGIIRSLDLHKGKILKPDTDLFRRKVAPHIKTFNSTHGVELK